MRRKILTNRIIKAKVAVGIAAIALAGSLVGCSSTDVKSTVAAEVTPVAASETEATTESIAESIAAAAAQYAIDNVKADWNKNALESAKGYSDTMHFSKTGIYDQLISEYGNQFLPEEAQYAVDNIEADYAVSNLK